MIIFELLDIQTSRTADKGVSQDNDPGAPVKNYSSRFFEPKNN